jgi:hypothetical protein
MLEYDQITEFYLQAIQDRIKIERSCKEHGVWRDDTFPVLVVEMASLAAQMALSKAGAYRAFQTALEIANAYIREARVSQEAKVDFATCVDNLLEQADENEDVAVRKATSQDRLDIIDQILENIDLLVGEMLTEGA